MMMTTTTMMERLFVFSYDAFLNRLFFAEQLDEWQKIDCGKTSAAAADADVIR